VKIISRFGGRVVQIVSVVVFAAVMVAIMTEQVHRSAAALAGAVILIISGVLTGTQAVSHVDFNTLGVLLGMMLFVSVVKKSGLFEYVAIRAAKMVNGDPWKIMVAFVLITAVLSAFLDNVTTVLLVGPMTIVIAGLLNLDPVPFLLMQILASNIGGTGTLIGDPPNIMIGSAAHLSFVDFIINAGFPILFILGAHILIMKFMYKKKLYPDVLDTEKVMAMDENEAIKDLRLMKFSLLVLGLVVVAFMLHDKLDIESSLIALSAGALMLIVGKEDIDDIIVDVEWKTLLFFISLFVVVGGMVETGVIDKLSVMLIDVTHGKPVMTMIILLWASALLSAFLDNIPFVATIIPLVLAMQSQGLDVTPYWWAISLGACLGGNGTLIGASANVVLSDISAKQGHPISFAKFFKVGFPMMIVTVAMATVYLLIKYYLFWA
jgi:Na+/H+ antiporter NhaD/arsenite permease-like protein